MKLHGKYGDIMRCLVTGGSGFVGSNLVRRLINDENEVHMIVRKTSDLWRVDDIKNKITFHYTDLSKKDEIRDLIKKFKFDIVYHFAVYGGYNFQKDINKIINTNVLSTWNLFEECTKNGVQSFINTSSSSEYGEKFSPMREDMILEPNNMYGASKCASTLLLSTYSKEIKFNLITIRLFSPYGYFDSPSRLIPTVIKGALNNDKINLASKTSKRDFIFIDDVIEAYIKASTLKYKYGEIYNVGTGIESSVEQIVEKIIDITKSKSILNWNNDFNRQYEPKSWVGDISKMKNDLIMPKISIDDGLLKTIEWFKKNNLY